jgi:thiamine-phosphate pyrophosphorylase
MQLARDAWQAGASYVAFGGFYPSRVKKYEVTTQPEIVAQAKREIPLPNVVIGGMTHQNSVPLIAQGADMVAAISSVYMTDDPEAAARTFAALFTR